MNLKEIREWTTCIGTIFIIPLIAWAWWSIGEKEELQAAQMENVIQTTYETKIDHAADMSKLQEWTQKLQSGETQINLNIEHLSDKFENSAPQPTANQYK